MSGIKELIQKATPGCVAATSVEETELHAPSADISHASKR